MEKNSSCIQTKLILFISVLKITYFQTQNSDENKIFLRSKNDIYFPHLCGKCLLSTQRLGTHLRISRVYRKEYFPSLMGNILRIRRICTQNALVSTQPNIIKHNNTKSDYFFFHFYHSPNMYEF